MLLLEWATEFRRYELPGIVDFGGVVSDSAVSAPWPDLATTRSVCAYSVRRSLATCGVMVILWAKLDIVTGGGRRKDKYQYILPLCTDCYVRCPDGQGM
jgi:hypothetical protein